MTSPRDSELSALAEYAFQNRSEEDVRADWIDPLLRLLGYGLGTRNRVRREVPLPLSPPLRMIGSRRVRVDYVPTVLGQRLWVIEAKRPQPDLFDDAHLGQAWTYATDPRIRVPLMMLCDGERIGVFDVTQAEWDEPVLDMTRSELPNRFDELNAVLGARRVAEWIRVRQLAHLQEALGAQLDLGALDATVVDVQRMIDNARPIVTARRDGIRREARDESLKRGIAAVDKAGTWGLAQELNGPLAFSYADLERIVEMVRRQPISQRVAEFDRISEATGPRAWFSVRVLQMAAAVALSQDEGCAAHCTDAARRLAHQIATAFGDDRLLAATYELQRILGPLGWHLAAAMRPLSEQVANTLLERLEVEEWLNLDGRYGLEAHDSYRRVAVMGPRVLLNRIEPWDLATVQHYIATGASLINSFPTLPDQGGLQPAGDPFLRSWREGDPARAMAAACLKKLQHGEAQTYVRALARELFDLMRPRS